MNKKILVLMLILCIAINFSIVSADINIKNNKTSKSEQISEYIFSDDYYIQWEMNFGSNWDYGGRFEGPQPIGDCDNDGKNEMLIAGCDNKIRVFEWDEIKQTYLEMHTLFPPLYPIYDTDAGGFAIGDLDGDDKNEIGSTWGTSVHKFVKDEYKTIAYNAWIFNNGGGSADCLIGDYDNDGENELIVSGGASDYESTVPEIVIYKLNNFGLVKEAVWDNPDEGYTYIYMPGIGDIDNDGDNEIVCGSSWKVFALDWNKDTKKFDETVIKSSSYDEYPFACVIKDSDGDGKNEINIGYLAPMISIFEWNGENYDLKFEIRWPNEDPLIEGLDVGDVDDDGFPEVCAGTDVIHILQWNGDTYVEEAVLPTWGWIAVVSIGDCDNDGKNEINVGNVEVDHGKDFMSWVYKYGSNYKQEKTVFGNGRLKVTVKRAILGTPLEDASVAAWNLGTKTWYDIIPDENDKSLYTRQDLPEGDYVLRVLMEGYKIQEANIKIIVGQETVYSFSLQNRNTHSYKINLLQKIYEEIINKFPYIGKIFQFLIQGEVK